LSGGAIEAGRAVLKLSLDDKELGAKFASMEAKLQATAKRMQSVGLRMAGAGAAIVAPLALAVNSFIKTGSALKDFSDRTGIAVERASELKFAAEQSGTSFTVLEKAIVGMTKRGLDPKNFDSIAAGIAAIEDPTERARAAIEAFGAAGPKLLPMLRDLPALSAELREMGGVMSTEAASNAEALGDAFDKITVVFGAVAEKIGSALAPSLLKLAEILKDTLAVVVRFTEAHPELVVAVGGTGVALLGLGTALNIVAYAIKGVIGGVKALRTALVFLMANPWIAAITAAAFGLAYLTNGFGLLTASAQKSDESLKRTGDKARKHSVEMARLARADTEKVIAESRERDRRIQADIAKSNRNILSTEKSFMEERRRQRLTALERFVEDNAKKLAEANALERKLYLSTLSPSRRRELEQQDEQSSIAPGRCFNLVANYSKTRNLLAFWIVPTWLPANLPPAESQQPMNDGHWDS
jgi:hypothetical protein